MQIDVNRLKGKTVELGLTGAAVAEKLGIDQSTYYRKLGAGGGSFTIAQAQMISKILELSPNERLKNWLTLSAYRWNLSSKPRRNKK